MRIDWAGLIVGFESRSHQITHFFDRETGDVEQVLVRDAARHAAMSSDARYVPLPRDEGERTRGDLESFLGECEDETCRMLLARALESADFAGEYRRVLLDYPREESRFFQFKEHEALRRAQEWLRALGIVAGPPPLAM
jgi:hypothetical protein